MNRDDWHGNLLIPQNVCNFFFKYFLMFTNYTSIKIYKNRAKDIQQTEYFCTCETLCFF